MRSYSLLLFLVLATASTIFAQNPTPFACSGNVGFGYYTSSATNTTGGGNITYSNSRLSTITTSTGTRADLCSSASIGVALNGLAFNPHDNFLYAVSRYDASAFSGTLYRIGENCQKSVIPVTGSIKKYSVNSITTVDNGGGNIGSATFDLDNNYYVNTSYTDAGKTGFTNVLQVLEIVNNTAVLKSNVTLTCPSCTGDTRLRVTDIIFDEATGQLLGSNKVTNKLYSINPTNGVLTEIGTTGITTSILGMYKNKDGNVRAISSLGNIYSVNILTGVFTLLSTSTTLNSGNADGASGCYAPPSITGTLFIDANGMTDNLVNGIGTSLAGTTTMYANLVQGGLIVKTDVLTALGTYQFLGLFSGTYEVQISSTRGTEGQAPPAQNLPSTYKWEGDQTGPGPGSDGSPNGLQTVIIASGQSSEEVNFGINGLPITSGMTVSSQENPGGITQVTVPALIFSDPEETSISNITIQNIPNTTTHGTLYYNGIAVTNGQNIPNYNQSLLTIDPVDGDVDVPFTFFTTDMAGAESNVSTVILPFAAATVPVELLSFTGRYINGKNILQWITASEVNSSHFILERRGATGDFYAITNVQSVGSISTYSQYSYTDKDDLQISYYRLVQVDFDGKKETSHIISINSMSENHINIYPSITQDYIKLETMSENEAFDYYIFDINGQQIRTGTLSEKTSLIDVHDLANGTYFINVATTYNYSKVKRFIKF